MKRKNLLLVATLMTLFALLVSCTSSVGLEEFNSYKMDRDNEITSLIQEIEIAREKISALESDIVRAENKNATLKNEIDTINENFTRTYSQINDLVILAGYNSGDDFLNLAKDIVYVNNNIKELNEKIENLREAMALFVNK